MMPTVTDADRRLSSPGAPWTLDDILSDKEITKAFLKFSKTIYSEENALFYLAVEKYKVCICWCWCNWCSR